MEYLEFSELSHTQVESQMSLGMSSHCRGAGL